jgi:hypothetical protein
MRPRLTRKSQDIAVASWCSPSPDTTASTLYDDARLKSFAIDPAAWRYCWQSFAPVAALSFQARIQLKGLKSRGKAMNDIEYIQRRLLSIEHKVRQLLYLACGGIAYYFARSIANEWAGLPKDNWTWGLVFFAALVVGAYVLGKVTGADD